MHRLATSLVLTLSTLALLTGTAGAQEVAPEAPLYEDPLTPASPDAPAMDVAEPADPFLYEVRGPGEAPPSYLFGTVHVQIGIDDLAPVVLERFRAADAAVFEADVRTMSPFAVLGQAQYGPGESLEDHLSAEQLEQLAEQLQGALPADALPSFRPWFVMTMQLNVITEAGMPLDLMLVTQAEEAGTDVRYLETWQDQLDALQRVPESFMVRAIVEMLDDEDAARAELDRLLAAYRDGDAATVGSIVLDAEELEQEPAFYEELLFARNEAWVPQLDAWFQQESVFVAVGVGHLLGERSVIEGLEALGYEVERVTR